MSFSITLVLVLVLSGCGTLSGPGSASFASVTIKDRSPEQIHGAAAKVFGEQGYIGGQIGPSAMVFEKEASRLTTLSREGVVATQAGARTIERVRTQLVSMGNGSYRLQCEAFMVTGAGDSFFENEVRMLNYRSAPYRSLLNKVEKELQ